MWRPKVRRKRDRFKRSSEQVDNGDKHKTKSGVAGITGDQVAEDSASGSKLRRSHTRGGKEEERKAKRRDVFKTPPPSPRRKRKASHQCREPKIPHYPTLLSGRKRREKSNK